MMQKVPVKKLRPHAVLPTYGSEFAAGADLYACLDAPVTIAPGQTVLIPLGFALALPEGYAGFARGRECFYLIALVSSVVLKDRVRERGLQLQWFL